MAYRTAGNPFGGGASYAAWTGSAKAGQVISRGLFVFGCNKDTSVDPCIDFGNVGDPALFTLNGTGAAQDSANHILTLNAQNNGQSALAVYNTVYSGWDKRRIIADIRIDGTADGMSLGILDGALPAATAPGAGGGGLGVAGFWGADIEIYAGGAPGYFSVHNGTQSAIPFADNNANICSAHAKYDRYYLDFADNGVVAGTVTMTLWRNAYPVGATFTNNGFADDVVRLGVWTETRPTFTNWRLAFGAHTGGSAAFFQVERAYARSMSSDWTVLGVLPVRS